MGSDDVLRRNVVVAVNGQRFDVEVEDPSMTVLEFIRTRTPFRGPKLGCGEGGCGACVVLISKYDPATDQVSNVSANSCLTLLCSIDLCAITTTEGLGNIRDGFHSIHQRIAGFHASQCGFCTPGMCMSIYAAVANADKSSKREPCKGFSKLTVEEAERAVLGNICRCTGYRPILDACKSFACDVDLEDLGLNTFWRKGDKDVSVGKLPIYSASSLCSFPEFLKAEILSSHNNSRTVNNEIFLRGDWHSPKSIGELYELLNSDCVNATDVKLVVGNTSSGIYRDESNCRKYIDLKGIPELSDIKKSDKGIEIGAATTLSRTIEILREGKDSADNLVFNKIADHIEKVASIHVRNIASIGGNLVMAQRHAFASDIATILLAVGSTVCVQSESERLHLDLEKFLAQPPLDSKVIVLSIFVPNWGLGTFSSNKSLIFETYRAAPRPLGNAVSYLNCAFLVQVSVDKSSSGVVLLDSRFAFGAYGGQHAIRAKNAEVFLKDKLLSPSAILEAVQLVKGTIKPKVGTTHAEYRVSLSVSFVYKFLSSLANQAKMPIESALVDNDINGYLNGKNDHDFGNVRLSSQQEITFNEDYDPVGLPTMKSGALIQASGEAVYVDDIPAPKDCLYGAFVYSTQPLATVRRITLPSLFPSKKVLTFLSPDDIPKGGQNVGGGFIFGSEPLFADPVTTFAGQALGIVIAETQKIANMAAKQAIVDYDTTNLDKPVLSLEEAILNNSYFDVAIPPFLEPKRIGDFTEGMAKADQKIISAKILLGSQYYFYMETQTALAIPDEDDCITVYSSTQEPERTQSFIARCLGIPFHNVRVITRRVGGGFGGKWTKAMSVATACALAAFKLKRPVRMYMDRKTDMVMVGGRHPMKVHYTVGFKSDGKITALHLDILVDAGMYTDVSPIMPYLIMSSLNKYNWENLSFDIKVCKTNQKPSSSMRSPGHVQGCFIAEAIIEHVAAVLLSDTNSIRRKNLHTSESLKAFFGESIGEPDSYTLPSIFDSLSSSEKYQLRTREVQSFNSNNRWRKRGISCVPIIYEVSLRPTPGKVSILNDGSVAVEVGGIEIGQGLWTKVKQMTAYALAPLLPEGMSTHLLDRIRVIQADTLSQIQGGVTGGSSTSEASCEAARSACAVLVDRLIPIKDKLQSQSKTFSWDSLITQATRENVNLSASVYWVPNASVSSYLNYGAATTEVEIDVLTGATTILRTDIVYDCGRSLNPAVDLGQVEGAFVQGIGFFVYEECLANSDGLTINDGTWTYKVPTADTIPKQFNVQFLNSKHHQNRILSSKASGEPPLLLATSVHCAMREAIRAARGEFAPCTGSEESSMAFQMNVPATMPVVKELCGLNIVEKYLESLSAKANGGAV